jgi:hypothetical protein
MFTDAISRTALHSLLFAALAFLAAAELSAQTGSALNQSVIQANSNRLPAGKLENGILTLHLDLLLGDWYPEAETGPSMKVYAFAEEGKELQIPGPLIRVPEGTEIRVTLRNLLAVVAVVHGLHQHPGDAKAVVLKICSTAAWPMSRSPVDAMTRRFIRTIKRRWARNSAATCPIPPPFSRSQRRTS